MQQLTIKTIKENTASVDIYCNEQWDQEDIKQLCSNIKTLLHKTELLEHILGADKESFRLRWKTFELTLNFEVYSQSIWFENMPTGIDENICWKKNLMQQIKLQ